MAKEWPVNLKTAIKTGSICRLKMFLKGQRVSGT
jgi:hypothetical protein